ncbi:MAG: prepilin-type N-terminal cleavage/methylation domain-containing protein, partial [Fibrobacterota bacterium]
MRPGFSIVELVCVVVIIGILSTMAIPRFGNSIALHSADAAARRIGADLELARRRAMTTSVSQTVRLQSGKLANYTLVGFPNPNHPRQPYTVSLAKDCYGVELESYNVGGDLDLVFDMYGVPDSAGQIVIRIGAHTRTIAIDAGNGRTSFAAKVSQLVA